MLVNAFRVELSAATFTALYELRGIVFLNLNPILSVKLFDVLLFVSISSFLLCFGFIFWLWPFILWLLSIFLLLSARLRFATFDGVVLLVFLSGIIALFRGKVVRGVLLVHLVINVLVGVWLVAGRLALLVVVVLIVLVSEIYM